MLAGKRLKFGSNKYFAISLMLARWLRFYTSGNENFTYVTLGGTELLDVSILDWIDRKIISHVISYEEVSNRYKLAKETCQRLQTSGISVEVVEDSVFEYERQTNERHVFFLDLTGVCKHDPFTDKFSEWFDSETVRAGDTILITSYLGRNKGWDRVLAPFEAEFKLLRMSHKPSRILTYQAAHPLFVLARSLHKSGLDKNFRLECIGYIKYRDTSPMGLYGIAVTEGRNQLSTLVTQIPTADIIHKVWNSKVVP